MLSCQAGGANDANGKLKRLFKPAAVGAFTSRVAGWGVVRSQSLWAGRRVARFNPRSEFATSLPVFGCCARGTAKRLREMALVGETCLEGDKRNGFLAM